MILKGFSAMCNFLFEIFKIYFVIYPTWYVVDAEQAHAKNTHHVRAEVRSRVSDADVVLNEENSSHRI